MNERTQNCSAAIPSDHVSELKHKKYLAVLTKTISKQSREKYLNFLISGPGLSPIHFFTWTVVNKK